MQPKLVEDVFKVSGGVPEFTFVYPTFYNTLKVALRTPGRGVIIEGPSGIGKSTSVAKAFAELSDGRPAVQLSARIPGDVDMIQMLPDMKSLGTVVVDDFHRLPDAIRKSISDLLKVLADVGSADSKLVVIGINQAGYELIQMAPDLANRIDIIRFEAEPREKIAELISLGERQLNVSIAAKEQIIDAAQGSFYLAQMLSRDICIAAEVLEEQSSPTLVDISFSAVKRGIMDRQRVRFGNALLDFVRGPKFRPGGRAPYLFILKWLADSAVWSISLRDEMKMRPRERPSVTVVVDQGYLTSLVSKPTIAEIVHFNPSTKVLSVEDPHLIFYLRNLDWMGFVAEAGFTRVEFDHAYDVALSFAGEDRAFAVHLKDALEDLGHAVFYDLSEQSRILAQNVEEYLAPIYKSEAAYVVAVLGPKYGEKRWTIFESDQFKDRIVKGEVIPIWSKAAPRSAFDSTRDIGGLSYDPDGDLATQAQHIALVISHKLVSCL